MIYLCNTIIKAETTITLKRIIMDRINNMTDSERYDLARAKILLENPNFAMKLSNYIGMPVEKAIKLLPVKWQATVAKTTHSALMKGLEFSLVTLRNGKNIKSSRRASKIMSTATGAAFGAFGLPAIAIELPLTTIQILRSIADIARSEGHDLNDIETKLSCLEVFALGGNSKEDDHSDNGYWIIRASLSTEITRAAKHIAQKGMMKESAPLIINLINKLSARLSIIVTEEAAAKAIPVIGAIGGAGINLLFMDHFQKMAEGHFIVKRLEKKYGSDEVKNLYDTL